MLKDFPHYLYIADDAVYRAGVCLTQLEAYDQAIVQYARLLNYFPHSSARLKADALFWMGITYQLKGELPTAITVFEQCRKLGVSAYHGDACLKQGIAHFQNKEFDKAKALLTEVKGTYPRFAHICEGFLRQMK